MSPAAYEAFKSNGFDLISSPDLRKEIINLYEVTYPYLMQETRRLEDQLWPAVVVPLYQKHFRFDKNYGLTPTDYSTLLDDIEFTNMLSYRGSRRRVAINHKTRAKEKTQDLANRIDQELSF